MRDLEADLAEFNHWMSDNYDTYDPTLMWFSRVLPEAITRAIKAEDRVGTLQIVAKENYRMYENTLAENARLRKVAEAARAMVNHCDTWFISGVRTTKEDLRAALAELNEADYE